MSTPPESSSPSKEPTRFLLSGVIRTGFAFQWPSTQRRHFHDHQSQRIKRTSAEEVTTPAPAAVAEFDVEEVKLGRNLGPDGQVLEELGEFMPNDTIYVVVRTEGAGPSTLTARFLYEDGQLVDETTQTVSPTGETLTEFHVSKPDGWPAGEYEVKILVNGEEV